MTLLPTDERKERLKNYKEVRNKISDLIRSITNNSDSYDGKYMKVISDDHLPKENARIS